MRYFNSSSIRLDEVGRTGHGSRVEIGRNGQLLSIDDGPTRHRRAAVVSARPAVNRRSPVAAEIDAARHRQQVVLRHRVALRAGVVLTNRI